MIMAVRADVTTRADVHDVEGVDVRVASMGYDQYDKSPREQVT